MTLDSYTSPDAEALLTAGEERLGLGSRRRELLVQLTAAAGFLVAACLIAALAPWGQPLSVASLLLVLASLAIAEHVRFPVAGGWTSPMILVFVPALFVLPTPLVPLVAMVALLLARTPELVRRSVPPSMLPAWIGDAWFAIGPTVVIVATGTQHFAWSHWPVYAAALLAQFAFDIAATTGRCWIGEGISPRVQLPLLSWLYATDAMLAPFGLLIASVAVERPGLILLALSPMAMLWLFARERQQRMDETLALSTAYRGTAMLLGDVVEADHQYTGAHSRDVVDLSLAVAKELALSATERRNVEFAALLHDVGKIHVPKEIINKPGKLDDDEWAIIRGHTIEGERMLKQVGGLLASVGRIVRASHEHYNGGGYPDGLAGDAIPVEARIVSTCDAYSAMTTDRSYRKAMPKQDALTELRRCAGSQFDPQVVAAIEKLEGAVATEGLEWLEFLGSGGQGPRLAERRLPQPRSRLRLLPAVASQAAYPAGAELPSPRAVEEALK